MRIIIVSDYAHVSGGQARVAIESAIGLACAGHDVTYFAAAGEVHSELEPAGVRVVCLNQQSLASEPNRIRAAIQGIWNREAAKALSNLISASGGHRTIVHVHGWAKALSPSIGPVLNRSGLSVVYTMHEYFLACPNGAFYDFNLERNCPLRPLSTACIVRDCDSRRYVHKMWRVGRHALLRTLSTLPSGLRHIIYLSELQRSVMSPYLPASATLHNVPNPVNVDRSTPRPAVGQGPFVFVGRLSREKGGVLFAEAARKAGVKAVFVGDGECRDDILATNPDAEITGWLSLPQVIERLRSAQALVFPSVWYECQPLTVYEALANGVSVIVSDNCAAREAVRDGETGLLFRSGSVDDLARRISQIAEPDVAARMGEAAYDAYWRNPLTLERHVGNLERVYDIALSDIAG